MQKAKKMFATSLVALLAELRLLLRLHRRVLKYRLL